MDSIPASRADSDKPLISFKIKGFFASAQPSHSEGFRGARSSTAPSGIRVARLVIPVRLRTLLDRIEFIHSTDTDDLAHAKSA